MYESVWRCKWLADGATTLEGMALKLEKAAKHLREMAKDGVTLQGEVADDWAFLETDDKKIAKKYGFCKEKQVGVEPDNSTRISLEIDGNMNKIASTPVYDPGIRKRVLTGDEL